MQHLPEPKEPPIDAGEPAPAPPAHEFAESQDDPQQAEELERQQDA